MSNTDIRGAAQHSRIAVFPSLLATTITASAAATASVALAPNRISHFLIYPSIKSEATDEPLPRAKRHESR